MGSVYEDAYLTICATGAADGTEGCFAVAEAEDGPTWHDRGRYGNRVSVEYRRPDETNCGTSPEVQSDFLGPLQDRAWITQE